MAGELAVDKEKQDGVPVRIENLTVAPLPQLRINCGDTDSFVGMVQRQKGVLGIIWNEERISLLMQDRTSLVSLYPEINKTTAMFLKREETKRKRDFFGQPDGPAVWDGEFQPIQFTKMNLIKFLRTQKTNLPDEVLAAIKNMKVTERSTQEDTMLNLDSDDTRTVIEETSSTNIPKRFTIDLPVSENYVGRFEIEASVEALEDEYERKTKKKGIVLRCLNAREVLRDMMRQTLERLPPDIPVYYGAMAIGSGKKEDLW